MAAGDITELLVAWSGGNNHALHQLLPRVYGELRRLARCRLRRERPDHTLETSALIHEAFLRLVDQRRVGWHNRTQFFALAARMMRRILVDHARRRGLPKHGGHVRRIPFDGATPAAAGPGHDLESLDEGLQRLESVSPEQARVVELRFFGGLNAAEIGDVLGISPATVTRRWRAARAWLYRELSHGAS